MSERKTVRVSLRRRAPLAGVRVEEIANLITYTKGDLQYQVVEDDGTVAEGGLPLRDVLHEAVDGKLWKVSFNTGKQYTFSIKHLEQADPDTTYVVFRFGIRALPEPDGTPVRLVLAGADGTEHVLLSKS